MKFPIIHKCEQGTDEWFKIKLGKASASHFKDVLNKKTGRGLYMRRLAGEYLTGERADAFSNPLMDAGVEREAAARIYYEQVNNVKVKEIGFYQSGEFVGISPDGLVGDDGGVEIKCPLTSTHIQYVQDNKMPNSYVAQVQGAMYATGRKWWDFVSYDPRMQGRKYHCIRVMRDDKYIATLSEAVDTFVDELKDMIKFFETPF